MTLKVMDRIVSALSGLILLVLGLAGLAFSIGFVPAQVDLTAIQNSLLFWQRVVIAAAAVLLALMGLHGLSLLFRSGKEKGFIMQHTENGDLSISMHAMESMVKKVVDTHGELRATSTRIHSTRDGVAVNMHIQLASGVNIPLTINALQKQIKQYITSCSGVDVKEVRVMVETSNQLHQSEEEPSVSILEADANAINKAGYVLDAVAERTSASVPEEPEPPKEAVHQKLFKHGEEPQIVPAPPEEPTLPEESATPTEDENTTLKTDEEETQQEEEQSDGKSDAEE